MPRLRIGTRGSPLALYQAHETKSRLIDTHGLDEADVEIVVITTTGDQIRDRPLSEIGGKGLFTKEIEEALLARDIDLAVHSMKDVPAHLPEGLMLAATLPRQDPRDAFISLTVPSLDKLPEGATVGTSSVRRSAQLLRQRPDLKIIPFRGNVETRLRKLAEGQADATFLACAGLKRLGLADKITQAIAIDIMLPAIAQGAIGLETRIEDKPTRQLLEPLNDPTSACAVVCERAFLKALDGSCRTPIAGFAMVSGDHVFFRGLALSLDGRHCFETSREGGVVEAKFLGHDAGVEVKVRGGSLIAY